MRDATAKREQAIEEAADRRVQRLLSLDRILNRPIGSETGLSMEQRQEDFEARLNNLEGTMQEMQQRASAVGPARAALELLREGEKVRE